MEFIRDPPACFLQRNENCGWSFTFPSEIPCTVHKHREKVANFLASGYKAQPRFIPRPKKLPQPGIEIPLVLIFRTIIRPVYIGERALGRMVGCFQEINHIRKGFSHFTRIYWYACVCACMSVSLCACICIYILYIHTFFFCSGFFYFLLLFIHTADARKFRTGSQ